MSYCPQCGKELTEGWEFCTNCGCKLKSDETSPTQSEVDDEIENKEKLLAVVAHIGMAILLLRFGEACLIVPAIVYYIGKKKMSFSAKHAYHALIWGVVICTLLSVYNWIYIEVTDTVGFDRWMQSFIIKIILFVFSVYASYKALKSSEYHYPFMRRLNEALSRKKLAAIACLVIVVSCSVRSSYVIEQRIEKVAEETLTQAKSGIREAAQKIDEKYKEYQESQPKETADKSVLRLCRAFLQHDETSIGEFGSTEIRTAADTMQSYMRSSLIQGMRTNSLGAFSDAQLGNVVDAFLTRCIKNNDFRCRLVSEQNYNAVVEISFDRYNLSQACTEMITRSMIKSGSGKNQNSYDLVYESMYESVKNMQRTGRDSMLVECTYNNNKGMWQPTDIDSLFKNLYRRIVGG